MLKEPKMKVLTVKNNACHLSNYNLWWLNLSTTKGLRNMAEEPRVRFFFLTDIVTDTWFRTSGTLHFCFTIFNFTVNITVITLWHLLESLPKLESRICQPEHLHCVFCCCIVQYLRFWPFCDKLQSPRPPLIPHILLCIYLKGNQ